MGCQGSGAQVGGDEGEDFPGDEFRFNVEHARDGEAHHGLPILEERAGKEWVPAGRKMAGADFCVDKKKDGKEILGDGYGNWSAVESPVEFLLPG